MNAIIPIPRVALSFRVGTMSDLPFMDSLQKQHGKALGYFTTRQYQDYIEQGAVLVAESDGTRVGYCIWRDRYLKRDELGVIFQLCVAPDVQRNFIGAALVGEVFRRSEYGCRLYCLWCAQDLAANHFWESLGFVPLAFRAGSDRKRRVHIFWQKRIVDGDEQTRWWYPSRTSGGAIGAERLVFPIPPGTHWKDVRPVELPEAPRLEGPKVKPARTLNAVRPPDSPLRGFRFQSQAAIAKTAKPRKAKAPRTKIDAKFTKATRELRDRWMERLNDANLIGAGKYDVTRVLPGPAGASVSVELKALRNAA